MVQMILLLRSVAVRLPSLTFDVLVAVIALAERRTTELAAEELSLTPSAVHKRIRAAEALLGQRLFVGTDDGMVLTDEGRIFYPEAVRSVEQALLTEEKTRAFIRLNHGHILVGHSTYLPPRLLALVMKLELASSLAIKIHHIPGITASLAQRVVNGTLHVAFGDLPAPHPALLSHQLLEEPLMVCMLKSHSLAIQPFVRPQDLEGVPIIAVSRDSLPMQHLEIEDYFAGFGMQLHIAADAFGPPEALGMVEQNMGVSLLSASAAQSAAVVAKPLAVKTLTRRSGLYVRGDNRHSSVKEFIDLVLAKTAGDFTSTSPRSVRRGDRSAKSV
jgi:DNA-binding transcriptional LysR family regulator